MQKKALCNLDLNFKYWVKSATKKIDAKKGRLSGGQIVGIKRNMIEGWNVTVWDSGMILKFKVVICIISDYNNIGMSHLELKLKSVLEEAMAECENVFVCGDMNARVGEIQVCNEGGSENHLNLRRSEDETLNDSEKRLIKLGEELGLVLLNGRTKGDREGKITYVGGNKMYAGSVIDLVMMVDRDNLQIVEKLEIILRIKSDHLPVSVHLLGLGARNKERM